MRQVARDIAVDQYNFAFAQCALNSRLGFVSVAGIQKRRKVRIDGLQRTKVSIQEFAHHPAKPRIVLRESRRVDRITVRRERVFQKLRLGMFTAAIDALDGDQNSRCAHLMMGGGGRATREASVTGEWVGCNESSGPFQSQHATILVLPFQPARWFKRQCPPKSQTICTLSVTGSPPQPLVRAAHPTKLR